MNAGNLEWAKAKSEQMLRSQVEQIAKSEYPASGFAEGMLEAFYALGLISDAGLDYWRRAIEVVTHGRRSELNKLKLRALFDVPVVAGGELIAGDMHENG